MGMSPLAVNYLTNQSSSSHLEKQAVNFALPQSPLD